MACLQTTMGISRLKLCSESTTVKKFDYCIFCLFCCAPPCDQETNADRRYTIKPDRNRINNNSFIKSNKWYDKLIYRQLKGRQDDRAHGVRGRVVTVSCFRVEKAVCHRKGI